MGEKNQYIADIPYQKTQIMGIIRGVYQTHSKQEILEHSSASIINVQRFRRIFFEGERCKFIPAQTVKITLKPSICQRLYIIIISDF